MKLFISSDIEGTCGINDWDETEIGKPGYDRFALQMSREVSAACNGALETGKVEDILVKDAHDSARTISGAELPEGVHFIQDRIGLEVRDADSSRVYGKVTDIYQHGAADVYSLKTPGNDRLPLRCVFHRQQPVSHDESAQPVH